MKEILFNNVVKTVRDMCVQINTELSADIYEKIKKSSETETAPLSKLTFEIMQENLQIAKNNKIPICQDTGFVDVLISLGDEVKISGGSLKDAVNEGVRLGYKEGMLRKSMVKDPIKRVNTNTNTPAIIFFDVTQGDKLKITLSPKGAGSENTSKLKMLNPTATEDEIIDFVVATVKEAGGKACPPVVVGVGIGGDFAYCAYLAKTALMRNINERNKDPLYAKLEEKIENKINALNIGPQGFKGDITALGVNIEQYPTHIACLPVAVNISCHVTRHITKEL